MFEISPSLLATDFYLPHGHCYLWQPALVWLHLLSDLLIAVAYYSIPMMLVYFLRQREDVPFPGIFLLFSGFIIACGASHLMAVWTLWHPNYWVSGIIKAITAVISVITAIVMLPILPQAIQLPSPAKLQAINQQLQQMQLQLVEQEKMAMLGNTMAGVAHEINNPLGFLSGNLHIWEEYVQNLLDIVVYYQKEYLGLREKQGLSVEFSQTMIEQDLDFFIKDLPPLMNSMKSGVYRIRDISNSLRIFARTDIESKTLFNLEEGLESTLLILKYRLKGNDKRPAIQVIKDYSHIPEIHCYPGQINQVFINLIANAIHIFDEMSEGLNSCLLSSNYQIILQTEFKEQQVLIRIIDNGKGMSDEVKARIFQQGFTTKSVGKGTGLGLAIAQQIVVEKHGGMLTCTSEVGRGTIFEIIIPDDRS